MDALIQVVILDNTIEYKGYIGSVEYSENDGLFFGKVLGIRSLISYEGNSSAELLKDFHNAVDEYLKICANEGVEPEVAHASPGSVSIRTLKAMDAAVANLKSGIVSEAIDLSEFDN